MFRGLEEPQGCSELLFLIVSPKELAGGKQHQSIVPSPLVYLHNGLRRMAGLRRLRFLVCQRNSYPKTNSAVFILRAGKKARFWLETATTIHLGKQLSPSPAFLPSAKLSSRSSRCRVRAWHKALPLPTAPISRADTYKVGWIRTLSLFFFFFPTMITVNLYIPKMEFTVSISCVSHVKICQALAGCHPKPWVPLPGCFLPISSSTLFISVVLLQPHIMQ